MSSQDAAAYHGGGSLWGSSPTTTNVVTGAPTTTYGVLRMSGGEMLRRVTGNSAGSSSSQQDVYMHWNLPPATSTMTTTKLEEAGGGTDVAAFQAREMSDVIETIIRQQQQQQHPTTTQSLTADFAGLHNTLSANLSPQHRQQQGTTGTIDNFPFFLGQSTATTGIGGSGSTRGFIPSLPSLDQPALSSMDTGSSSGLGVDTADWVNDLTNDRSADILSSLLSDEGPDAEIEALVQSGMSYWLHPDLPDENVMLADRHWDVLNQVVPAYNRFVQFGSNVNRKLKIKFDVSLVAFS